MRDLIAHLDGAAYQADEIVAAGRLSRTRSANVTQEQADEIAGDGEKNTEPVKPQRLGAVGPEIFPACAYAFVDGDRRSLTTSPIPFVVEAWVEGKDGRRRACTSASTARPVTGNIYAARDKRRSTSSAAVCATPSPRLARTTHFNIWLNIITPYMPITSATARSPTLNRSSVRSATAVSKAVRKARKSDARTRRLRCLPKRRRGRQSPESEADYREKVSDVLQADPANQLDTGFRSRVARLLLSARTSRLGQGRLRRAEKLITACRKSGDLPIDICAEDASREAIGVEEIDSCDVSAKVDV